MYPGTMFQDTDTGTMFRDPGTMFQDPGTLFQDPGPFFPDPGILFQNPGILFQDPGTMFEDPGTPLQDRNKIGPGSLNFVPGSCLYYNEYRRISTNIDEYRRIFF